MSKIVGIFIYIFIRDIGKKGRNPKTEYHRQQEEERQRSTNQYLDNIYHSREWQDEEHRWRMESIHRLQDNAEAHRRIAEQREQGSLEHQQRRDDFQEMKSPHRTALHHLTSLLPLTPRGFEREVEELYKRASVTASATFGHSG